ncbi:MAG: hypothetical protein JXO44_02610 [Clostridia bacterium]|nr:hypothetical protein [Clostridia bacterium]
MTTKEALLFALELILSCTAILIASWWFKVPFYLIASWTTAIYWLYKSRVVKVEYRDIIKKVYHGTLALALASSIQFYFECF